MNFTRLRHLDLSGNEFKTLFAGVFRGLKRLETLLMRKVVTNDTVTNQLTA